MKYIYNILIHCYCFAIKLASLQNKKAKLWIAGRRDLFKNLRNAISENDNCLWFHCASLGEFEQGRPIIEEFKKKYPEYKIILTFFSPSGYEIRKKYEIVDFVTYLPADTISNAIAFIEIIKPKLVIFVKYEFWFNYITQLQKRQIPLFIVSANFRTNHYFFKWYGRWSLGILQKINTIFIQDKNSLEFLNSKGFTNIVAAGDTRFDRVSKISSVPKRFSLVEKFIQGSLVFIAGSVWDKDMQFLIQLINESPKGLKFIIVPHEIHENKLLEFKKQIKLASQKFSEGELPETPRCNVLFIDSIGMLSNLYQYASIAYIGGGFGRGIHNTLEAATFGMPILFGPNYAKFKEANDLIKLGGAFSINNTEELKYSTTKILSNHKLLQFCSSVSANYVRNNCGATEVIIDKMEEALGLY